MCATVQTEHRSELANDTICSLICAKQNQNMECYDYCPNSEVLKKAKTAGVTMNWRNKVYLLTLIGVL